MNIKCSELDNISVSFDYFNSIKAVGDEVIKYVRGFNQLSQEYIKKLQLFQTNFAKKLAKSDKVLVVETYSTGDRNGFGISNEFNCPVKHVDKVDLSPYNIEVPQTN